MKTALVLLLSVLAPLCATAETTLRELWATSAYAEVKPFPSTWLTDRMPLTELSFSAYQKIDYNDLSVRSLLDRFGKPSRHLVPTRKRNDVGFLIYDLPSGHSVAAYVSPPPENTVGAVVLLDPKGKMLRLIK